MAHGIVILMEIPIYGVKIMTGKYLNGNFAWAITLKDSKELIGTIDFGKFDKDARIAEMSYALSDVHWKKGIMSEAAQALSDSYRRK